MWRADTGDYHSTKTHSKEAPMRDQKRLPSWEWKEEMFPCKNESKSDRLLGYLIKSAKKRNEHLVFFLSGAVKITQTGHTLNENES